MRIFNEFSDEQQRALLLNHLAVAKGDPVAVMMAQGSAGGAGRNAAAASSAPSVDPSSGDIASAPNANLLLELERANTMQQLLQDARRLQMEQMMMASLHPQPLPPGMNGFNMNAMNLGMNVNSMNAINPSVSSLPMGMAHMAMPPSALQQQLLNDSNASESRKRQDYADRQAVAQASAEGGSRKKFKISSTPAMLLDVHRLAAPPSNSVPCRCRGMPDDHNPKTAYIVIPEDVMHGQALQCSHPICRHRGVRFRYCAACQRPVAKRNFSSRHNHPKEDFEKAEREKEESDKRKAEEAGAKRPGTD